MKKSSKILLIILIVILILGLLAYVFISKFIRNINIKEDVWIYSSSENGMHNVKVVRTGLKMIFADQDLIVYADGEELYRTSLSNDGKTLDYSNYKITWDTDIAILELQGEGDAETITIKFNNDKVTYHTNKVIPTPPKYH